MTLSLVIQPGQSTQDRAASGGMVVMMFLLSVFVRTAHRGLSVLVAEVSLALLYQTECTCASHSLVSLWGTAPGTLGESPTRYRQSQSSISHRTSPRRMAENPAGTSPVAFQVASAAWT